MRNCRAEIIQRVLLVLEQVCDGRLRGMRQGLLLLLHVLRNQNRERFHFGIVVRVDAHLVLLQLIRELAVLHRLQLVLALQVWPAPQTTVDYVGHTFARRQATAVFAVQWAIPGKKG